MMREMQIFDNKPNQKQYDKKKMTTDDVKKAEERKTREAEIAAMTAQMLATSAQIPKSLDGQEAKRSDGSVEQAAPQVLKVPMRTMMVPRTMLLFDMACPSLMKCAWCARGHGVYRLPYKLWDFAGMARNVRPFREIEVEEGYPPVVVSYSPSGNRLLAVTGSSQPKVLTREGVEEMQFAKGNMYVVDVANTNGHTHTATGGQWHPKAREQMITSSLDGTMRLWKTMLIPFRNIDLAGRRPLPIRSQNFYTRRNIET
ncbi:hypothetical protein PsorP6_010475 [Peronosclerospora sorghi]|uniref:Uncharacterized protein n=1 Tax=Peronosclerospora sorghi TaxID=230839 RepID=A0ACC0VVA5_9STRA|nr:hypothetical protein PsorP6_010475 [Peronosclerospora sorghi]